MDARAGVNKGEALHGGAEDSKDKQTPSIEWLGCPSAENRPGKTPERPLETMRPWPWG